MFVPFEVNLTYSQIMKFVVHLMSGGGGTARAGGSMARLFYIGRTMTSVGTINIPANEYHSVVLWSVENLRCTL